MSCQDQDKTPLTAIVEAFEKLATRVENLQDDLPLKAFCDACSLVSVLFDSLGIAFKFAEMEYCAKVFFLSFHFVLISLFVPLVIMFIYWFVRSLSTSGLDKNTTNIRVSIYHPYCIYDELYMQIIMVAS